MGIRAHDLSIGLRREEVSLRKLFEPFGPLSEVHIPIDKASKAGKGFAYILFLLPEHAVQAMTQLDGKIFQVRRKAHASL